MILLKQQVVFILIFICAFLISVCQHKIHDMKNLLFCFYSIIFIIILQEILTGLRILLNSALLGRVLWRWRETVDASRDALHCYSVFRSLSQMLYPLFDLIFQLPERLSYVEHPANKS